MHTAFPPRALAPLPAALLVLLAACDAPDRPDARFVAVEGASAERGQRLLAHYQCGSCHAIPGVPSAAGRSGPPLDAFGRRSYIAGQLPNGPRTLTGWLLDPQALLPQARMPKMGASEADARDMAAYLLSLR
jgi:cytochrome c1